MGSGGLFGFRELDLKSFLQAAMTAVSMMCEWLSDGHTGIGYDP